MKGAAVKKTLLALLLLCFVAALPAYAVDSFTVTEVVNAESDIGSGWPDAFKVVKVEWTAAANGSKATGVIPAMKGHLKVIVTDPGATAPADNYDLTLIDQYGIDVLGGGGLDRDTTNTEAAIPLAGALAIPGGRPIKGPLTATFANTTNANCNGTFYLYIEK